MQKLFLPTVAVMVLAAVTASLAVSKFDGREDDDRDDDGRARYAIGLWGDMPYSAVQDTVGIPNLIADMNSQDLAFTAHDGDLKAGSGPCPDSLYQHALDNFNSLRAPAIFTPGDNDWIDCGRNVGVN